jgi:uncharacterized membrane protein
MDFDIGSFIAQYYINPILYNEGYNVVNTLTYAIILGISLFAVLKLMDLLKVKFDERMIIATAPFIVMGASSRVLEDVKFVTPPLSYMFITPLVYFLAFFITVAALILCLVLQNKGIVKDYTKPYFAIGVVLILVIVGILTTKRMNSWWWAPILVFSLAFTFTGCIYLVARHFKIGFLTNKLNIAILFAHMFDASSTFTAIDIVGGFMEKHVVPTYFIGMTHTAFVMYGLKLVVFIPVIYLIEKYFKEDEDLYYLIKFVLLVLGFGPGIRNTLEMTFI